MVTKFTYFLIFSILCCYNITQAQTTIGNLASYTIHYSGIKSGNPIMSHGTPQTIWQDPNNPANIHMVFMYGIHPNPWWGRTNLYLFSGDTAHNWSNLGEVSSIGSISGFGAITGLSDGRVVIGAYSEEGSGIGRTQIYVQESPGAATFIRNDPGAAPQGNTILPRVVGIGNNKVFFISGINTQEGISRNLLTLPNVFRGFDIGPGYGMEGYSTACSEDGSTLGIIYEDYTEHPGDLIYLESNDLGITWNTPFKIWDYELSNGTNGLDSMRVFSGMQLVYINNSPSVIFEVCNLANDLNGPVKIVYWNPSVNNGNRTYIAETDPLDTAGTITTRIPWLPVTYTGVMPPISRPTIGRSTDNRFLYAAFHGTNGYYFNTGGDSVNFWGTYFALSSDQGRTWSKPERFTDGYGIDVNFLHPSISPTNYCNSNTGYYTVQMYMISDSMPRDFVTQTFVSTECVNVTARFSGPVSVEDEKTSFSFELNNNYPNPFNPSTKISFSLSVDSRVSIKVFDLLGQEAAELVNNNLSAGEHTVDFNASKLASGVYIYKLDAVSSDGQHFTAAKKMLFNK